MRCDPRILDTGNVVGRRDRQVDLVGRACLVGEPVHGFAKGRGPGKRSNRYDNAHVGCTSLLHAVIGSCQRGALQDRASCIRADVPPRSIAR